MHCLVKKLAPLLLLCALALPWPATAQDATSQFRMLSLMIRDELPTSQESKDFYNKIKTLDQFVDEWLATTAHRGRMHRYFNDMFGMDPYPFLVAQQLEAEWDTDHFKLPADVRSTCSRDNEITVLEFQSNTGFGNYEGQYIKLPTTAGNVHEFWFDEEGVMGDNISSAPGGEASNTEILLPTGSDNSEIIATRSAMVIDAHPNLSAQINASIMVFVALLQEDRANINQQTSPFTASTNQEGAAGTSQEVSLLTFSDQNSATLNQKYFTFGYNTSDEVAIWFGEAATAAPSDATFNATALKIKVTIDNGDNSAGKLLTATSLAIWNNTTLTPPAALPAVVFWGAGGTKILVTHDTTGELSGQAYSSDTAVRAREMSPGGNQISVNAWWSDTPVTACTNMVSSDILLPNGSGLEMNCSIAGGEDSIFNENCGCGPNMILCYPGPDQGKIRKSVSMEFADRGIWAYEQERTWKDLLASDQFYGDRYLYWFYLMTARVNAANPSTQEMTDLMSLPIDGSRGTVAMPADTGPERAGVATMPSFMKEYNNFRSRIRALTNQLLCKDVDSSLNTDGIQTFVNPTLSVEDVAHGELEGCASCHYALDNFASAILGWVDEGFFAYWENYTQEGHVFGETGTGPEFLMDGYIERSGNFHQCMAKRAWEDFTGNGWDSLSDSSKTKFVNLAKDTPKALIEGILKSQEIRDMRDQKVVEKKVTKEIKYDFAKDINPIIKSSCAGGGCHEQATPIGDIYVFEDDEERFRNINRERILDGSMPPPSSDRSISDEDRDKLLLFLK